MDEPARHPAAALAAPIRAGEPGGRTRPERDPERVA